MKTLAPDVLTMLDSDIIRYDYLVKLNFNVNTLYLTTSCYNVDFGGHSYLGNGWILGVNDIEEFSNIKTASLTLMLSGVESTLLYYLLNQSTQSATVNLYLGFFDEVYTLIEAHERFFGQLAEVSLEESPSTPIFTVNYESFINRLAVRRERRYTPNDQKADYINDQGFAYVPFLSESRIYWGQPDTTRAL